MICPICKSEIKDEHQHKAGKKLWKGKTKKQRSEAMSLVRRKGLNKISVNQTTK